MKDKYEFMLALRALAFEIQELRIYSQADPDCFELLKHKLDQLCHFMSDAQNEQRWHRWHDHEEVRLHSGQLRETSVQALCDMEKYQSLCTTNQQLNVSDYLDVLAQSVREELAHYRIDHTSQVLFIGSGAFPLSALTIAKETGARLLCLDIDAEALELGRQVAATSGLADQVQFASRPDQDLAFLQTATHIVIASLVPNKREMIEAIEPYIHTDTMIVLRYGNGLKSIFNYPWEADLAGDWEQTQLMQGHRLYDTVVLQPKKLPLNRQVTTR